MSGNTIGEIFRVTTFGESHGAGLGTVIDGCPAGIAISAVRIQAALDRRKPGISVTGKKSAAVTTRSEADTVEILSGVFNGISEGTPIALLIRNTSQHSGDYDNLVHTFRPGHADYTYSQKYGFRDHRGGGRSSGRETAARVAAGAVAQMILDTVPVSVKAYTLRAAGISCSEIIPGDTERNTLRAADCKAAAAMEARIEVLRKNGDSAGGIIECRISGVPAGLGEPVFCKLDAELAKAMLSIGAVKGIEFGAGFAAADLNGSTDNDFMCTDKTGTPLFRTNNAGGVLGGISSGNDIIFRIAVKPVPSILRRQQTVSEKKQNSQTTFEESDLLIEGRHDVCLCPRIVPVAEAMSAIVLADMYLRQRSSRI